MSVFVDLDDYTSVFPKDASFFETGKASASELNKDENKTD
jgi:hypothetical protein